MVLKMLAALVALSAATPVLAEPTIEPGYWESTSTTPLAAPKTERRCITADKVEQYLRAPSNSHYQCTYSQSRVRAGKVDLIGQCKDKHGRVFEVAINGVYTPETFSLSAQLSLPNLPLGVTATTKAHRISPTCPTP